MIALVLFIDLLNKYIPKSKFYEKELSIPVSKLNQIPGTNVVHGDIAQW